MKKMLMNYFVGTMIVIALVLSTGMMSYAVEKAEEASQESAVSNQTMNINGVVKVVDGEAVIISDGVTYYVNGPDLSAYVDRKIAANGMVETYGNEKTINITDYQLMD